jgi:photosystem II stability/assembly factor-like uncharacterized protein
VKDYRGHEEVERALRRALHAHAERVQPSPDALDRIRRRVRVRRVHPVRRIGLVAAVAAAVAAVVVLPATLRDGPQHSVADRGATQLSSLGGDQGVGPTPTAAPSTPVATTPSASGESQPGTGPSVAATSPQTPPTATTPVGPPESTAASTSPTVGGAGMGSGPPAQVYSVTNVSTAVGYALTSTDGCGSCGVILKTSDAGATWSRLASAPVPLDPSAGASAPAKGVWGLRFADQDNGWLFGSVLYSTHDGGKTWSPAGTDGRSVRTLEVYQGAVYAAVASCDAKSCRKAELLAAPVGADDWKPMLALPTTSPGQPPSLSFGQGGGGILRVGDATWVDEGDGWTEVSSPQCPGGQSAAAAAVSGPAVFVFCITPKDDTTAVSVWRSQNAGRSWSQIGDPATMPAGTVTVTAASPTTLAVATDTSALQVSFDAGKTWSAPASTAPIAGWRYLGARSADLISAVAAHTEPGIWSSSDGGHTWTAIPIG